MSTLAAALNRTLRLYGKRPAVLDGDHTLTWREAHERMARTAAWLAAQGLQRGERFAILALNSPTLAQLLQAGWHSGLTPVPLNHRLAAAEWADILQQASCRLVLVDPCFAPLFLTPPLQAWQGRCHSLEPVAFGAALAAVQPLAAVDSEPDDEALLLFTGGTTGRAKGVPLSHAHIIANALQVASVFGASTQDVVLHAAPMFHSAELVFTAFLMQGAAHTYLPRFTPELLLQTVQRHRVTVTMMVPTMLMMLMDSGLIERHDISSLKRVIYGASPMPREAIERVVQAFPGVAFTQGYGLTETAPILSFLDWGTHQRALAGDHPERLASCGRPLPGVDLRIVASDGREQTSGQAGEIVVRGANVFGGYLQGEALQGGALHTGDVGIMDDEGYVFILDRLKDVVITGGENVYSGEVEAVLQRHADVAEVAVIGVPDDRYGEAVHAVVVLRSGAVANADANAAANADANADADSDALREHCRSHIGAYKIPRSFSFVSSLPRSAMGKVLKAELRRLHAAAG